MAVSEQKQLLKIIETVDHSGNFYSTGELPSTHPGLIIEGIGLVGLPLDKRQVTALKKKARQAPYGKGTQTVVDTKVRRVWEIDAEEILFGNSQWETVLKEAVDKTQDELGLKDEKLEAHFYKLLIYEKGGFFLPHRDGEKLDRMVATLVIVLPSTHQGGELVIRHDQKEVSVDFSAKSSFNTQFAAFFADCEHEVRPVTSGVRLALVYNLTISKTTKAIKAPSIGDQITKATAVLSQWKDKLLTKPVMDSQATPSKLAVILDHKYSEAGLSQEALKGIDRTRAETLFAAAKAADCDAFLALVTYWVSGSPEETGYSNYGRRRRRGYGWNHDEDEDEVNEHVMDEVYETSLTAEHFTDSDDFKLTFGKIPIQEIEIVSKKPISDGKPDQEEYEGYTGNAGMSLEHWYHRAAILVWPKELRFNTLFEGGFTNTVGGLEMMVRQWSKAPKLKKPKLKKSCQEFAERIIANWPEEKYSGQINFNLEEPKEINPSTPKTAYMSDYIVIDQSPQLLLEQIAELDDISLISLWITCVLAKDATVNPGKRLGQILNQYGWSPFQKSLQTLFAKTDHESLERHAWLLADWALQADQNPDRKAICAKLADLYMKSLLNWNPKSRNTDYDVRKVDCAEILPPLTLTLMTLNEMILFDHLVVLIQENPNTYDLIKVQVPVLLSLKTWFKENVKKQAAPLDRWLRFVVNELELRKSNPPIEPLDWVRGAAIGCKCADCETLRGFLIDPKVNILKLPMAEKRRIHLQDIIKRNKLDIRHETICKGSPFTLVCTKTNASYEAALKSYDRDLIYLSKVQRLLD